MKRMEFTSSVSPIKNSSMVKNNLETWCKENNREDLLKEWDYEKNDCSPADKSHGSRYKAAWKCSICGCEWMSSINGRTQGNGCPGCRKCVTGKNDLETWCNENNREDLLRDWDYERNTIKPNIVARSSSLEVYWKCSVCGYQWTSTVNSRTNGNGCPACAGRVCVTGVNDLETWCKENHREDLLEEWDYEENMMEPSEAFRTSTKEVHWVCSNCGYKWTATIKDRTRRRICGCQHSSSKDNAPGRKCIPGTNDLETWCKENNREDLLKEWDYENNLITPSEVAKGSSLKVHWKCSICGCQWVSIINNRTHGNGCPGCAKKKITPPPPPISGRKCVLGKNDLETWCKENDREDLLEDWDYGKNPMNPNEIARSSNKKVFWKCSICGYRWISTISNRTHGNGCPDCAKKRITPRKAYIPSRKCVPSKKNLESWCRENNREDLLEEWDYEKNPMKPNEITKASSYKAFWKCNKCEAAYSARVANRTYGTGCPYCADKKMMSKQRLRRMKLTDSIVQSDTDRR